MRLMQQIDELQEEIEALNHSTSLTHPDQPFTSDITLLNTSMQSQKQRKREFYSLLHDQIEALQNKLAEKKQIIINIKRESEHIENSLR